MPTMKKPKAVSKMFWVKIPHPTSWNIKDDDGNICIPKGTTGVEMAPHQSSKTWTRSSDGKVVHQHAYRCNGIVYNA